MSERASVRERQGVDEREKEVRESVNSESDNKRGL